MRTKFQKYSMTVGMVLALLLIAAVLLVLAPALAAAAVPDAAAAEVRPPAIVPSVSEVPRKLTRLGHGGGLVNVVAEGSSMRLHPLVGDEITETVGDSPEVTRTETTSSWWLNRVTLVPKLPEMPGIDVEANCFEPGCYPVDCTRSGCYALWGGLFCAEKPLLDLSCRYEAVSDMYFQDVLVCTYADDPECCTAHAPYGYQSRGYMGECGGCGGCDWPSPSPPFDYPFGRWPNDNMRRSYP